MCSKLMTWCSKSVSDESSGLTLMFLEREEGSLSVEGFLCEHLGQLCCPAFQGILSLKPSVVGTGVGLVLA